MSSNQYLYFFTYEHSESDLCKLESKYIFQKQDEDKLLFSNIKAEPCNSAFIKNRLEITSSSEDYENLLQKIQLQHLRVDGFKIEYIVIPGDTTEYKARLGKLRDIGIIIQGIPDYYKPTTTFGITYYRGMYYFGYLKKDTFDWYKHKKKPHSYSNSISNHIAKAAVNIASKTHKDKTLIDVCCGVGTILLEACFAGYNIEGCDHNWKICNYARKNLTHFDYTATVHYSDIKDIEKNYDAVIVDLPYNLSSAATESEIATIVESTANITNRQVIISTADISQLISSTGFEIIDHCRVTKQGKRKFSRQIWVCEAI